MQRRIFIGAACAAICAPTKLLAGTERKVKADFELSQYGLWDKFFIRMWEDGTLSARFGCEHLLRRGPDKSGWYVFEGPTASIRLRPETAPGMPSFETLQIDWFKVIQPTGEEE